MRKLPQIETNSKEVYRAGGWLGSEVAIVSGGLIKPHHPLLMLLTYCVQE